MTLFSLDENADIKKRKVFPVSDEMNLAVTQALGQAPLAPDKVPFSVDFSWTVDAAGNLLYKPTASTSWLSLGPCADALAAFDDFSCPTVVSPTWRFRELRHSPEGEREMSPLAKSQRAEREDGTSLTLLSRVAALTTLRLDPQRGWRMLSPNPVVSPLYGPAFSVATDGIRVLLADRPSLTEATAFVLVHRSGLLGPQTATPTRATEWNWTKNCRKASGACRRPGPANAEAKTNTKTKTRDSVFATLLED